MARPNPHRPFTPDPDLMTHAPAVSGNTINGLGEQAPRPPRMVYWAPDPSDIAHGAMQKWFYTVDPGLPVFAEIRAERQKVLDRPLPPVAENAAEHAPEDWTARLDRFTQDGTCEQIGVAEMDPAWVYAHGTAPQSRIIVLGVRHDFDEIATAPAPRAGAEVLRQYCRAAAAAKDIAAWLRGEGWAAEPVTGPMTSDVVLIPPALACGFGELGKHGSIINREMGASFRLSAVLTDAPFAPTPPRSHGIDAFCQNCRICEDACPPEAIFSTKKTVRGTEKWYVDFDRCLPYFNQHQGCAICIAVCPWSRPGTGPRLADKLERRAARLSDTG